MKKIICLIGILMILIILFLCIDKSISKEQSKRNFEFYAEQLKTIIEKYNYSIIDETDSYEPWIEANADENYPFYIRAFMIIYDKDSEIKIYLTNENEREMYSINWSSYLKCESEAGQKIPVGFLTELVEVISGRDVTEEECRRFLDASEEKYSTYGKTENELIRKYMNLNFFEDWIINYTLTKDLNETFEIGGLTK